MRYVPGAVDTRINQPFNYPNFTVNVDRTRAVDAGLTQQNVAQSLLVSLSGSFQTSPTFYLDPRSGVSYSIAVEAPQYRLQSLTDLKDLPITGAGTVLQPGDPATPFAPGSTILPPAGAPYTAAPGATKPVASAGQSFSAIVHGVEQGEVSHYDIELQL